jgi:hypothetical protein
MIQQSRSDQFVADRANDQIITGVSGTLVGPGAWRGWGGSERASQQMSVRVIERKWVEEMGPTRWTSDKKHYRMPVEGWISFFA